MNLFTLFPPARTCGDMRDVRAARVSLRDRQGPQRVRPMSWEGELSDTDLTKQTVPVSE